MRSVAAKFSAAGVSTFVGASAFAGIGAFGAAVAPNASATAGCTSPSSGVTVVVQFTTGTAVGCAPGAPKTALDALRGAGFTTTGTVPYGDAFLCSINGKPISGMCPRTPPASAYWALFSAQRGGSWSYAKLGVTSLHIPVGGVVGYRFGSGSAPSMAVPAAFPSTSNTKAPAATTTKTVSASAPVKSQAPVKTSAKPTVKAPAAKPASTPSHSANKSSSTPAASSSQASSSQKASSSTSRTASPTTSVTSTSAAPITKAPVVKATQTVHEGNATKVIVTYNDGSKATVAPSVAASGQYKVGAMKSEQPTSMAKASTQVPAPSNTSHPSIWTSGSVPVVPAAKSGSSNLPGIIAGVGVVGAVAAGGAVAIRRRG